MKAAPTNTSLGSGRSRSADGVAGAAGTAVLHAVRFAKGGAGASGRGLSATRARAHICCEREKTNQNRFGLINKTMEFLTAQSQVAVQSIECSRAPGGDGW